MSQGSPIRNHLKEKLARDEVAASMTVRLARGVEIAQLALTAGFDSIYVDLEHNSFSLDTTSQICMAAQALGVTPLVRTPGNSSEIIRRVLDGGAMGIIAPHVKTAGEAREIVRHAKLPPTGERSFSSLLPQLRYESLSVAEGTTALNEATMVVLMLETADALDNVEEIAAVEGMDMLMVGTNDLSAELGVFGNYDHPLIGSAFKRTIAACRTGGKHAGIGGLASRADLVARFVASGARYVSTGSDLAFLLDGARARASAVRKLSPGLAASVT